MSIGLRIDTPPAGASAGHYIFTLLDADGAKLKSVARNCPNKTEATEKGIAWANKRGVQPAYLTGAGVSPQVAARLETEVRERRPGAGAPRKKEKRVPINARVKQTTLDGYKARVTPEKSLGEVLDEAYERTK